MDRYRSNTCGICHSIMCGCNTFPFHILFFSSRPCRGEGEGRWEGEHRSLPPAEPWEAALSAVVPEEVGGSTRWVVVVVVVRRPCRGCRRSGSIAMAFLIHPHRHRFDGVWWCTPKGFKGPVCRVRWATAVPPFLFFLLAHIDYGFRYGRFIRLERSGSKRFW